MKKIIYIFITLIVISFQACDYLDIVPDEVATDKDAFKDAAAAKRYLYSCYAYLSGEQADPRHGTLSIDLFTSDEVVTPYEHETFAHFAKGTYTPTNPYISYWNNVFAGIRQCYLLIENIDDVPGMSVENKKLYKAEATFLIAYYHYQLIKNYGPTIIIRERASVDASPENYLPREPYDVCVKWVADKFDEAVSIGLLTMDRQTADQYGRATVGAAKAIKARMLLYAASPLFNGASYKEVPDVDEQLRKDADDMSEIYNNFKDKNGNQLISTTYSQEKWELAAEACREAIEQAERDGHKLYYATSPNSLMPYPFNQEERNVRMTITDRMTEEIIWASTTPEDGYSVQAKSTPYCKSEQINWKGSWNGLSPRLNMVEAFYTKNGLPIDVDPEYDYENRYAAISLKDQVAMDHADRIEGATLSLHLYREPRFYSWISFHNGFYEIVRGNDENKVNRIVAKFRSGDEQGKGQKTNDYSPSGYLNKKGVHPLYAQYSGGGIGSNQYPWPIIRLGELYLNYAEALIEINDIETAKEYINKVRVRAGIKELDLAWSTTGKILNRSLMRKIVRQERQIELYLENQRFWDVRRWLVGRRYFNTPTNDAEQAEFDAAGIPYATCQGLNISGITTSQFLQVDKIGVTRQFKLPQNYLMPIPMGDMNKNPNIVQNPGYE